MTEERRSRTAKVLLEGKPGSGKTTAIMKVLPRLSQVAGGFYTEELRSGSKRVGFKVTEVVTGKEGILAHIAGKGPQRVGKYKLNLDEFERIALPGIEEALKRQGIIVIDEIGKMELFSERFREIVTKIFDSPCNLIATIRSGYHPFTAELKRRSDVALIEVTPEGRDAIPERVAHIFEEICE